MPKVRKRVTNRGVPLNILQQASDKIRDEGRTVRAVAKDFDICHTTLFRFHKKREKLAGEGSDRLPSTGYWTIRKVFSEDQEKSLTEYLKKAADLYYGLSSKEVRKFAFQLASRYKCNFPPKWIETGMAGVDWFTDFLKRHPTLSIRRPQSTSLSRATSSNRTDVNNYFDNLSKLESSHQGSSNEQGTTKTKIAPATMSSKDSSSQLSQATAAKVQKKTGCQLENQCFEKREQKAMPNSVQPSPPAPTQMHAHLLVAASSQPAPLQVSVAKQKLVENPLPQEKRIFVVADHQRCVMSNLAFLWKSGKLCDAGIGNGSSTVMVHKLVLSAVCPKLFAMFNMDIKSHEFLQVNFPREVSTEALNAFAEYMYNGILDLDYDILEQLKIIAKRLDMKEFEQLCDSHLSSHIPQPVSAVFTNVPLIQTSMQIPFDSAISTSMLSAPSITAQVIDVEPVRVQKEPAAMFSQASLSTNKSGNAAGFVISPSIKTEPVGPEDDKYGLWSGSSHNQAFTSTNSSSLITTATTASTSIASVPVSSTEFAISSSEATDIKSTRLKTTLSCEAPLISDLSSVSNIVETGHSQTSSMNENSSQLLDQPSDSLQSVNLPKINKAVYPVRLFSANGDNLPLLTTDSSDAMTVNSFIPSEKT